MARKVGQIIARGDRRWLIRVYLGRDHESKKRNYHNRTIRGSMREAQAFLKAALPTPHGPVLAVALTTGMRPSEYLALKWQDLDWTRQTVSVVGSVLRLDGRWCFSDTKRFAKPSSDQAAELDCCPSS